jgi:hypothetical protein
MRRMREKSIRPWRFLSDKVARSRIRNKEGKMSRKTSIAISSRSGEDINGLAMVSNLL